ncbi:MAG: hypothetical protein J0H74_33540 [Chitinophagaceae bacterium]|nr:hypothetical protein [Chitinophagaceae bacterium]
MNQIIILRRKSLFLLFVLGLTAATSQAQLKDVLSKAGGTANAGSLLSQFAGALKPTSLLSSWASGGKTNWLSAASKVSDAVSMAKSVSSLTSFIKPDMFKQGFNVGSITQAASTVKTMSDAGGLLKTLEGGLKPAAFLSSWTSKRPAFMSALNMLK